MMLKSLSLIVLNSTYMFASSLTPTPLETGGVVVVHDKTYYKSRDVKNNVEIIYTKDNLEFAKKALSLESYINTNYKRLFNWEFDETLFVGLISSYNQIPNGFSSQSPNNRQINYMGGTQMVEYFCSTSWLDTLLYHESAHNYQLNVKGSRVSRALHSVFKNASFILPIPVIIPNSAENSFMLEGNAVLNESWHGNGGRLYSGRFKAETILQAKAGKINARESYNQKIAFPYRNIHYIQGGFYNLFMAEEYGLETINRYFLNYSYHWYWPIRTNRAMYNTTGINFEKSLSKFSTTYADLADELIMAEGIFVASSQFFYSLGNSKDEIYFVTNESGVRIPELIVVDKKTLKITKDRDSWIGGKVLKVDDEYFTQGSNHTSVFKIYQGLFDNNGFIKDATASKMVQGYLSDGRAVYFDVASSYSQPQLHVGSEFYTRVNSSVIIDKDDNLYYFKQDEKRRTLYKNRTPLFSFEGFYGMVSDVDSKGNIYFVANSKHGSSLYRYSDGIVTRASKADNIVEIRLVDDYSALVASVSEKDYYYVKSELVSLDEKPFETKLFFEDKEYYAQDKKTIEVLELNTSTSYNSLFDIHYSGTNLALGSIGSSINGTLNINFSDPLSQNSANIYLTKDESNITIAGASYANSQYLLKYKVSAYGVVDDYHRDDVRDAGVIASAELPFLKMGYYYGSFSASFYQDYETLQREPLSLTLNLFRSEYFGVSMYANYINSLQLYGTKERDDEIYGASYSFKHELPSRFYFGVSAKFSKTDIKITDDIASLETRGIKVSNVSYEHDKDPTAICMPNIDSSSYYKQASYGDITVVKVFNYSSYWFTFPFSIQRESVFAKYRYYSLENFDEDKDTIDIKEFTLGATIATVFINTIELPFTFEYIYNDDSSGIVKDNSNFRFIMDMSF